MIDAAVPRHPTGKPVVERNVQYLRESFFRGETWLDRDHVQREAVRWCVEVAGQRIHGTTRRRPLVVFENDEKPKLQTARAERFDPPVWAEAKVHPDHHIQFQKGLYSVPTRHVGKSRCGCAATRSSCASTWTASASRPTSAWARASAPPTTTTTPRSSPPTPGAIPMR